MYLVEAQVGDVLKWKKGLTDQGAGAIDFFPWLASSSSPCFIMSAEGKKVGYCLITGPLSDKGYAKALAGVSVKENADEDLFRILPNLMRSLHVDSALVRTDDAEMMRVFTHYSFDFYHLLQVYAVPESASAVPGEVEIRPAENADKLKKDLQGARGAKIPGFVYDDELVPGFYEAFGKGKKVGEAVALPSRDKSTVRIVPFVRAKSRRPEWEVAIVGATADMVRGKQGEPVVAIRPDDDAGARMVNELGANSLFDVLRLRPSFHRAPVRSRGKK